MLYPEIAPFLEPIHLNSQLKKKKKKKVLLQGATSKFDTKSFQNAICSHSNLNFSPRTLMVSFKTHICVIIL